MKHKILSQKNLLRVVSDLKNRGKKIVTLNGSFDILHIGHIKAIEEAKKQGDILIILLNSDKSVKSYKGQSRPVFGEKERAEMLSAIQDVDYVAVFDEINPIEILKKIRPDVHCNGQDWGKNCIERETVENGGGKIHIVKWENGASTSSAIKKIAVAFSKKTDVAVFLDRDGTINKYGDGYVFRKKDFKLIPGSIKALKLLSGAGYRLIIITNQSGIGRGYYTLKDFKKLNGWMVDDFKKRGVAVSRVYFCPHTPEDMCGCRKPSIGMLLKAAKDFNLSLNDSWLVGDSPSDIIAGRMANLKTIKIGSNMKRSKIKPHFYAGNLAEAADLILKNH